LPPNVSRFWKHILQGEELSCMLVGDGAVGKTTMIISYIFNGYTREYRQTAFDVFTGMRNVIFFFINHLLINISHFIGQEEFGQLRCLCYAHVDVFILCFSLVNPVSFHSVSSRWISQIRCSNPTSPIILVGTQSDLRHNVDVLVELHQQSSRPVGFRQARRLADRIRAQDYMECSALTQHNLKAVFDSAVSAAIRHKHDEGTQARKFNPLKRLKSIGGLRKMFRFV
uniref:Ras homolog family member V n=1 Tax=Fundulus heteroclitus TaxID=8078 RepID=A0A3Q2PJ33_FUNHE